jgi:hypothetical protein
VSETIIDSPDPLIDNRQELVAVAVAGRIAPARVPTHAPAIDGDGRYVCLPGHGGVALGVHSGSPVSQFVADHLMVGASIEDADWQPSSPGPLHLLSCIGNSVRDARGRAIGIVAGKRGGIAPGHYAPNLLAVEAPDSTLDRLMPDDRIVVEAIGRGLRFPAWPDVGITNASPRLIDALRCKEVEGRLSVGVKTIVPAQLAGAGLGQDVWIGDLEIAGGSAQVADVELRFGDLVAFRDLDGRVSRYYRPGFFAVGLVSHGPSPTPGHGIGVTILLSGPADKLAVVTDQESAFGRVLRSWGEEDGPKGAGVTALTQFSPTGST